MNRVHRWFCRTDIWRNTLQEGLMPWALDGVELGDELLEVGPGPGLATERLLERAGHVTAIEIDPRLAASLRTRLDGRGVTVVEGDATDMPFPDESFSGAVALTMLHHVPSAALQDRLLAEVHRVLRPGSWFAGSDSRWSRGFALVHLFDTLVAVNPATFTGRLEAAGFEQVAVVAGGRSFRFRARRC